jgi:hypothetical protein
MDRDKTVALFLQGREAWNAWAEKMLAERKALEEAGRWAIKENSVEIFEPANAETHTWMKAATADFSFCRFLVWEAEGAEETAEEKQEMSEEGGLPVKQVRLKVQNIDFDGFVFPGVALFRRAAFSADTRFANAVFSNDTSFSSAIFSVNVSFSSAIFLATTRFDGAAFSGYASFKSATFSGEAWFERVTFSGAVSFRGANFRCDAWLRSATFQSYTSFREAEFRKQAILKGIKVERAFDMTGVVFEEVPAFNQADFKQAPDLDDVRFPLPRFWRQGKAEFVAHYRAIRRMAIQGADYEREHMAFKGELRSRRWTVDKFWHPGLWLGLFYDGVADCGRSIVRPAGVWAASIAVFAAFYWQRAAASVEARCGEAGSAAVQALYLSVKNALVIFGGTRDARVNQAYLCLYDGSAEQPHIPPTVTFMETLAQIPVSATLIFLFLLAVKNRFKIK